LGIINLAGGVPVSAGMTTILEIRRFQLSCNDNDFMPEILRRKGLNQPITHRY